MNNHEPRTGDVENAVDSVERLGLIRHGVAEGIALGERRAIAHGALIGAPSAAVIMTLAWVLGSDLGVVGAGTIAVSNVLSWAYLTRTRPVSVKRWRAEL